MMTVERLFASILGSAFSIRSVELWDGEEPEALLQQAQEKGQSSRTSKNAVPANTRRRSNTYTGGTENGASSSKQIGIINGSGTSSRPRNKSEGTQTPLPLPRTAEGGTQTEEPYPPNTKAAANAGKRPSDSIGEVTSSRPMPRPRAQTRSESMASDVSMSGAVQDDPSPRVSKGKQRSDTGDSAVSTGAYTTYTTASETLQRRDSGFDSAAPRVRTPTSIANEVNDETPRRGLQAPPIRPADNGRIMNLRGGVSPDESQSEHLDDDSRGGAERTPIKAPPQSRRSSFQKVFGKKSRDSSSKTPSLNDKDDNHGIPPTGLDGRRPLFNRRRSSAIDPKSAPSRDGNSSNAPSGSDERPSSFIRRVTAKSQEPEEHTRDSNHGIPPTGINGTRQLFSRRRSSAIDPKSAPSRDGNSSNAPSGLDERPSSFTQRETAKPQKPEKFTKDNNFGIPPGGLDDKRPLSFIRRTSAKVPGPERNSHDIDSAAGPSSTGERPLSFIRRSKGKATEEPEKFSKDNGFGIPPTGL